MFGMFFGHSVETTFTFYAPTFTSSGY